MCVNVSFWRLKPRSLHPTLHKYLYLWSDHCTKINVVFFFFYHFFFFFMLEHTCNINCFYMYQEFSFSGMNFFGFWETSHVSPRKMWASFQQNKVVFQIIRLRFANAFNTIEIWDPGPCLFMLSFLFIFFPIILALQFLRKPCFCRVAYAHDDHTILFGSRVVFLIDYTFAGKFYPILMCFLIV